MIPPASLGVRRKALVDTTLNWYNIPKGTTLIVNLWAIHHDPKHWENLSQSDPERFLDKNGDVANPASSSYLPFSAGRRVCLGEMLAKADLFLFITQLWRKLKIKNPPDCSYPSLEGNSGLGLKPNLTKYA